MHRFLPLLALLAVSAAFADRITLKNGESFDGDFFGATSQEIRFVVDGKLMTFSTVEVTTIHFGEAASSPPPEAKPAPSPEPKPVTPPPEPRAEAAPARPPSDRPSVRRRRSETVPSEPSPEPVEEPEAEVRAEAPADDEDFHIPRGTRLVVRLNETVDSTLHQSGETFDAELHQPVRVAGRTVLPSGTSVVARLIDTYEPTGGSRDPDRDRDQSYAVMAVDLIAILIDGERVGIHTNEVRRRITGNRKERALEGLARAGRELGTILGGPIGGRAGRTAEDTVDMPSATGGQIPSGSVLSFILEGELGRGVPTAQFSD